MSVSGSCHCGATRFTVATAPTEVTQCNCTYCSKVGALWAYYKPEELIVTEADGKIYAPNGYNKHHFCATCGCNVFGESPEWSLEGETDFSKIKVAINARLLDDFDLGTLTLTTIDGRNLW